MCPSSLSYHRHAVTCDVRVGGCFFHLGSQLPSETCDFHLPRHHWMGEDVRPPQSDKLLQALSSLKCAMAGPVPRPRCLLPPATAALVSAPALLFRHYTQLELRARDVRSPAWMSLLLPNALGMHQVNAITSMDEPTSSAACTKLV